MATFDDLRFEVNDGSVPIARAHITFKNGYGASVVFGPFISEFGGHGEIFEVAVLKNGKLCYDSGIMEDVLNNLTVEGVNKYLKMIENL